MDLPHSVTRLFGVFDNTAYNTSVRCISTGSASMPFLNAKCFYCGIRTGQRSFVVNRRWKCNNCEAINHLDETGQISDPPDTLTSQPFIKYAYPVRKPTSPVSSPTDKSLFCATCLKNQHLVTQTLAEYLPPPHQHDYSAYESSYEEYRKGLEQRYPQVCSRCEPGVQQHLRVVDYAAKTDHLRRMIANTKMGSNYSARAIWGWREIIVVLMGVLCCASITIQLIWHIFGVMLQDSSGWLLQQDDFKISLHSCFLRIIKLRVAHHGCYTILARYTKYALFMACVSVFWNRRLLQKLKTPGGRIQKWGEHLRLQLLTLFVRVFAWWYLHDSNHILITDVAFRGAHFFMLVFLMVSMILSLFIVDIVYTPKNVIFNDAKSPLSNGQESLRKVTNGGINYERPSVQLSQTQTSSYNRSFPINNLASAKQQTPPTIASLPLSPTSSVASTLNTESESEQDDSNEMEWTPTKPAYQPLQSMRPLNSFNQMQAKPDRTGLFGHSLRNNSLNGQSISRNSAYNQPFRSIKREPFPTTGERYSVIPASIQKSQMAPHGLNGNGRAEVLQKSRMTLSESKLRLPEGILDTGLEPLFEKFFAIRDEPPEIANVAEKSVGIDIESPRRSYNKTWLVTTTVSFLIGLVGIGLHLYH